jgi:hypothetical protein
MLKYFIVPAQQDQWLLQEPFINKPNKDVCLSVGF